MILLAFAAASCPIDRTIYRLDGAPQFEAGFVRPIHPYGVASDLHFYLRTPRRTFWFTFTVSQGHASIGIVPTFDPHHDSSDDPVREPAAATERPPAIPFAAFDARLRIFPRPPQLADRAPARLFAAGLHSRLYYDPVALAEGDGSAEPEEMPEGMFVAVGCAPRPH